MRAIVLLCLLVPFSEAIYNSWSGPTPEPLQTTRSPERNLDGLQNTVFRNSWNGPDHTPEPEPDNACLTDQSSCGCCLMKNWIYRMGHFFNTTQEEMNNKLTNAKTTINNMRASQSAFSVALNDNNVEICKGPFPYNITIVYKHVFLNLGEGYNVQTGNFTVPRSGLYSFAVTLYGNTGVRGVSRLSSCLELQVNNQVVAELPRQSNSDLQDSATVVLAVKLQAGDEVAVNMLEGCVICDNINHQNTFTGFLLYSTD